MSEAEFIYNGVPTTIQCKADDKMKLICQKFKDKAKIDQNNIFYFYDGKVGLNEEGLGPIPNPQSPIPNYLIYVKRKNNLKI